jgi:hypothetical protein
MKTALTLALALLLVISVGMAQDAETDTTKNLSDEPEKQTIYYGMNYGSEDGLGYYALTINNPETFHLSSGLSVLNTLRGQAPNLGVSAYAPNASASLRTGTPLYVIDGLTYNNSITSHYNLNASEYQSISVVGSGNAAARFGGGGLNSVIFLQRKTGAGLDKPTFDLISYTTLASNEPPETAFGGGKRIDQWILTNGIAYAQDFGAIDTRVSYTYSHLPAADNASMTSNYHMTSINTGLELGDRFSARLILDQYANLSKADYESTFVNSIFSTDYSGKVNFLAGNLAMRYQLTDWLAIASQGSVSRIKDTFKQTMGQLNLQAETYNRIYQHQQRSLVNLFLDGSRDLNNNIKLNFSAGYQIEKYNPLLDYYMIQITGQDNVSESAQWMKFESETKSLLAEVGFNVKDYFSTTVNFQHSEFTGDESNTYVVSTGLIFSEAFNWKTTGFSFGKLRLNYGKSDITNNAVFPFDFDYFGVGGLPIDGTNFEAGIDLGFANNKLSFTVNRFYNLDEHSYSTDPFYPGLNDLGEMSTSGWDIILGTKLINSSNFTWSSKINWGTIKTKLEDHDDGQDDSDGINWQGGFLNQFNAGNWFMSFLIDARHDKAIMQVDYIDGMPIYRFQDGSQVKLRDLSVGYNLTSDVLHSNVINKIRLSLSARNLWTISKSNADLEQTFFSYSLLKTFSLSACATF